MTDEQKALLQDVLARLNARRRKRRRPALSEQALPRVPREFPDYYIVDTFQVRRHWRRRPVRK